jgi:PHS family inorganic phosphate transporter-like MFS transporter
LQAIGFGNPPTSAKGTEKVWLNLKNICVGNLILSVAGLIPGYYVSFLLIDSWGRKPIQIMGFTVLTILFAAWVPCLIFNDASVSYNESFRRLRL